MVQKNVSSHSGTKMQLGSGLNPGKMGLLYVVLAALDRSPCETIRPADHQDEENFMICAARGGASERLAPAE